MTRAHIVAGNAAAGQRLDHFLNGELGLGSRARAQALIEAGAVRVNGRPAKAGQRLAPGDTVAVAESASDLAARPDPQAPLEVCHEDRWLVVVNKPAGMPSHPLQAGERGTLASALLARYPEMRDVGYSPREPGILHRLDTDTSGLMLAARDAETFARLRAELTQSRIDKRYQALIAGALPAPVQHHASLRARGRKVHVRLEPFEDAVPICTEILTATPVAGACLLELRVAHARRHQIRAHMAALGHPLFGDVLYGGPERAGLSRHFLHASELHLQHPHTGKLLSVRAALPVDLSALLTQ